MKTVVCYLLAAYWLVLFVRIIWSWFPTPQRGIGRAVFEVVYDLTEPVLRLVRERIPGMRVGMLDLSPILIFVVIGVIQAAIGCGIGF